MGPGLTLTDDKYKSIDANPRIDISFEDGENKKITISDNGVGMNKDDLKENLGTIARSGTRKFVEMLSGDYKKDSNLIGQFGVGFYSCFMVADHVDVVSKKAGEDQAYIWTSDGKSGYKIDEGKRQSSGTDVILYMNEDGEKFANRWEIQNIIKKYSNHIPSPVYLHFKEVTTKGEGDKKKETTEQK